MSPTTIPLQTPVPVVAGNTDITLPENRIFYPALDGIRTVAFLMVFAQHYLSIPWGWSGVDLFFVLSGFLITGILYDSRNDTHRVRNFYVRRSLRIFPLYYSVMLVLLLAQPVAHWNWSKTWIVWPAYLGNFARFLGPSQYGDPVQALGDFQLRGFIGHHSLQLNLGHFWSLCIEEQFYLVWPWLVFWICDRRKLASICALSVPVALSLRLAGHAFLPGWMLDNEVLYRATPFRIDALLFGGLLALAIRSRWKQALLTLSRYLFPALLALLALWGVFSPYGHIWRHHYQYPAWHFTWGLTAIDFIAGSMILVAIQPQCVVHRLMNVRALRALGRITYGLYVFHDIPHNAYAALADRLIPVRNASTAHDLYARSLETRCLTALLALLATIVLAWLSYRFLESPILNLKERWTIRGSANRKLRASVIATPMDLA
ncbi:acyltransferase [Terriglobus albidus]|uniref:Acyltransferase n=1 Tax=Terriglobus albidus TaxID=1592106 RepID=A0A5B9EFD7_9BACT|nr:acyltransferase [Terriglobus albidus]QEE30792.1 acyltransferase [Terriglobus albidus]